MSLDDIVYGISLFDETPEDLWEILINHFSDEYFLPVVGKKYGHLFANDTQKQQEYLNQAINQSEENEKILKD
jgi:hypothetical protein